jgi:hypothetical protein
MMIQKENSKVDKEVNPDNSRSRVIGLDSSCSSSYEFSEESNSPSSSCSSDTSAQEASSLSCSVCSNSTIPQEPGSAVAAEGLSETDENSPKELEEHDESTC